MTQLALPLSAISASPKATMTKSNDAMTQSEFSLRPSLRENYGMDRIYYVIYYIFTVSRDGKFSNMLRNDPKVERKKQWRRNRGGPRGGGGGVRGPLNHKVGGAWPPPILILFIKYKSMRRSVALICAATHACPALQKLIQYSTRFF